MHVQAKPPIDRRESRLIRETVTLSAAPILPADDMALVSIKLVQPVVGLKDSALYERISAGKFPRPLRLSYRCSRFRVGDVRRWLADPLGWSPDKALDAAVSTA